MALALYHQSLSLDVHKLERNSRHVQGWQNIACVNGIDMKSGLYRHSVHVDDIRHDALSMNKARTRLF